jgi:glycolate oxidase
MTQEKKIKRIYNALTKLLGEGRVIKDSDILEQYASDETSDLKSLPNLLVRAASVTDVSNTLKICNKYRFPVIPRGAGTGVTGGAVPVRGGLVLSLELMNSIIEIDQDNMIAVVEPCVITGNLQKAVQEYGLMYPPDPASLDICSIGGNVAEGAGGPRAVKYGTTKDYVLGLEYVLPDGSIVTSGGKYVKDSTGYHTIGILIGSEGTLAVITKIYLKLIPAPETTIDLLIPFKSIDEAIDTVSRILRNRIIPSTIEFMEEGAINIVSDYLQEEVPFPNARAHLLIQIDGNSDDEVHYIIDRLIKTVDVPHDRIIIAETVKQRERIWKARRSIRESIQHRSTVFLAEDSVVPRSKIPSFLKDLKAKLNSMNLTSIIFGHAGDGNVHINILKGDMDNDKWNTLVPRLKEIIYGLAISHGGTITGEHGIGFTRKNYLKLAMTEEEIDLLKRIKSAFDPNHILNPDKIF